jgi:hypothetical protein
MDQRVITTEVGRNQIRMAKKLLQSTFPKGLENRAHCIEVYNHHNDEVVRAFGSRVLTYDAQEGWGPLCEFLGVSVPNEPFPVTNTTAEFRTRAGLDKIESA